MALQKIYDAFGDIYYVDVTELPADSQGRIGKRQKFEMAGGEPPAPGGINNGAKTVDVAGTAEQLVAVSVPCVKIIMTAEDDNTSKIYYGGSSVSSSSGDYLFPAQKVTLEINDLQKVYIDAETSTDGVKFTYFTGS